MSHRAIGEKRPPLRQTFRALRNYNYRLFWTGQIVSQMGTWMQRVAQAWLVLSITNSPLALGTIATVQFSPVLLFGLFGGVIADRFPKRKLLMISQSVMLVQAFLFAVLTSTGYIELPYIYILALVLGIASALDTPARQSFIVEMVGPEDLPNAVALNSTQFNLSRIVGPGLGGLIIAFFGVAACFWLNTVSFLAVLAALAMMRPDRFYTSRKAPKGNVIKQIGEGLRYVVTTPDTMVVVLVVSVVGMLGYNMTISLPLVARYVLHWGPAGFGTLTSAMGVGSLIGALGIAYTGRATRRTLLLGAGGFSVLLFLVGISQWGFVTIPLLVGMGMCGIVYTASSQTRLQLVAPPELRGRVMSIYSLMQMGSTPIGGFITGFLSDRYGVSFAIAVLAVGCLIGVLVAATYAHRMRGRMLEDVDVAAAPPEREPVLAGAGRT
jgi:MFS family permease